MNLTALPTLQKMVLMKLTTEVICIHRYLLSFDDHTVERMVEKILAFNLPKLLNESLKTCIQPIGVELFTWIFYISTIHSQVASFCGMNCSCLSEIDAQDNLRWQSVGLIDKEQTFLNLIQNEYLDIAFRFVLACNCCSETNILGLWKMLSRDMQSTFTNSKFSFLPVVNYWTMRLEKAEKVDYKFIPSPPFPYVFEYDYSHHYLDAMYAYYSTLSPIMRYYIFGTFGRDMDDLRRLVEAEKESPEYRNRVTVGLVNVDNVAALKYFLKKLERIKKQKLLEVVARNHFISNELLVFCLSEMSDNQVTELLRSGRRIRVISCLVNSPWQESFRDFVGRVVNDLTDSEFKELYCYITDYKMNGQWCDNDYAAHAQSLWKRYERARMRRHKVNESNKVNEHD